MKKRLVFTGLLLIFILINGCENTEEQKSAALAQEKANFDLSLRHSVFFSDGLLAAIEVTRTAGENAEIEDPDHKHVLVNDDHLLEPSYEPEDLMVPDVRFSFAELLDRRFMREEAAAALESMFHDAEANEHILFAVSGFRSYDRQKQLFTAYANAHGEEQAWDVLAIPGASEHQTGLAMDITSASNDYLLSTDFADTEEGKWVNDHAHEHGFIIRYLEGKEEITGITFEPWHLRYVGQDAAEELKHSGLTLERLIEKARDYQSGEE